MRVLQSGITNNFLHDQASAKEQITKLTTQISSGKKIAHAYENTSVYIDTLRLDSEINGLKGIQERTEKSKVLTDASDSALNDFDTTLIDFKTKLILAANSTLNKDNLQSIANELEQKKEHLMTLANSSINGNYLFSGSAVNVKPIDSAGNYHGNDKPLSAQISESTQADYSLDGQTLFLGIDQSLHKSVGTNVHLTNSVTDETLNSTDTVEDLMGSAGSAHFYLKGVKHDGEAFKDKITMNASQKISDLLTNIEQAYGDKTVKAELTSNGTIKVSDLKSGMSMLDFQMTASSENVTDTSTLVQKQDFSTSNHSTQDDKAQFVKEGNVLSGNIALVAGDNLATKMTKLTEIAHTSLDNKHFTMDITDINGNAKSVTLNLQAESTFSVDGNTYNIFDADDTLGVSKTSADDFTMGQLSNVISLVMSDRLNTPAVVPNSKGALDDATREAKKLVDVGLNAAGELAIEDKSSNNKDVAFSLYDNASNDFSSTSGSLSFMSNASLVLDNPKIDFFKDLDQIIDAIREGILTGDSNSTDPSNPGIHNAIAKLDTLSAHVSKSHAKIGAMSNNLQHAYDRAATLELNVSQLKSKVSDIDIAETVIKYQQVSLNYQAMMSTIAKVNSLTLLNYLK